MVKKQGREQAMESSSFPFIILILLAIFLKINGRRSECGPSQKPAALFLFGDSYLDVGNNNYIKTIKLDQANFWPYGESYFNYPTGRFSDGRLVSDFIGTEKEYSKGVNFASAGAGALVETFEGGVISLQTQLRYLKMVDGRLRNKLGSVESKMILSNAVFLFSVGTNDYMSPFLTNSTLFQSYSRTQYIQMVIGNLTIVIREIYKRGGRKFGFLNLGPLGCLPGLRILKMNGIGCLEEASLLAKLHNEALSKSLSTMERQLHGFKYSLYDFNANLGQRIGHPSKYVLLATSTSCLGHVIKKNVVPLFIFGDSLFDAGNNNYINTTTTFRSNFWPYGETYFNYPTGRFSDGRIIPDFIAEYAKLPLVQPYLQPRNHLDFAYCGTNFASAGASVLVENSPDGMVINLKTQLSYFKNLEKQLSHNLGDKEAKKLVSNAVYLFSIGSNDYMNPFFSNSTFFNSYAHDEYPKMVIGNITTVIKALIQGNTGNQCNEEMTALVKLYNRALYKSLQRVERELKGFRFFKKGGRACCGSGPFRGVNSCGGKRGIEEYELCRNASEYLFFDTGHPTQFANHQLAQLLWSLSSEPYSTCYLPFQSTPIAQSCVVN
ncbi:hypothetical protein LguiA_028863 [Lonicera macranthoides]